MIAPISVSWAAKRNERHASTKPPAVTDSHLWANAYTKMNRGREKWRQTGAEAFCFPPRCCDLTWARRRWYICSPAKLASLRLSDSTGIHVVWQRMHKQKRNLGLSQNTLITSLLRGIRPRKEKRGGGVCIAFHASSLHRFLLLAVQQHHNTFFSGNWCLHIAAADRLLLRYIKPIRGRLGWRHTLLQSVTTQWPVWQ